ncbi:MAG: hypothetical protein KAV48_03605 [Methanomicrobia archaeon]|nr:hypothetical protein [Methanomicrobia archaeon]MCK4432999.1 hypothetical protein [Methanomicrobia archaeon]
MMDIFDLSYTLAYIVVSILMAVLIFKFRNEKTAKITTAKMFLNSKTVRVSFILILIGIYFSILGAILWSFEMELQANLLYVSGGVVIAIGLLALIIPLRK